FNPIAFFSFGRSISSQVSFFSIDLISSFIAFLYSSFLTASSKVVGS
ncbi:unnamed protein product, partial [Musa acuminata var. zebrina]